MKFNKNSKPVVLRKERSLPKILPRIIPKPESGRLNFPKKDDSSLYEGVGKKHYGFSNSTSLQKLASPQVQQKIQEYKSKVSQKNGIKLDYKSPRQKSTEHIETQQPQKLYFSEKGKKQRVGTQLNVEVRHESLKTEQSKPTVYHKPSQSGIKFNRVMKTDVETMEHQKGSLSEEKRNSLLKNSNMNMIGDEDKYNAIFHDRKMPARLKNPEGIKQFSGQAMRLLNPTFNSKRILY